MAYKRKHHRRHHSSHHGGYRRRHHRHNPFGVSRGAVKDAVYVAAGAIGAGALPGMVLPAQNKGWIGVALTGAAAVAMSFAARMIGGSAGAAEALKGGLAAMVIRAVHEAGFAKQFGLGAYTQSWFAVPTSSDAYGRSYGPALVAAPRAAIPAGAAGMGYHRFRGRYAGNYGG